MIEQHRRLKADCSYTFMCQYEPQCPYHTTRHIREAGIGLDINQNTATTSFLLDVTNQLKQAHYHLTCFHGDPQLFYHIIHISEPYFSFCVSSNANCILIVLFAGAILLPVIRIALNDARVIKIRDTSRIHEGFDVILTLLLNLDFLCLNCMS